MRVLARAMVSHIVLENGRDALLQRLADPLWFHAFGCVLGFDWNSSGVTTTVCGALKGGLSGTESELGLYVCGGKGGVSRGTPREIDAFCMRTGQDGEALAAASRMSAKVDSACVQDGYELYHHTFIFTPENRFTVVQQGLRNEDSTARRYHWLGGPGEIAQLQAVLAGLDPRPRQMELPFEEDGDRGTAGSARNAAVCRPWPDLLVPRSPIPAPRSFSFVRDPHAAVAGQVGDGGVPVLNLVAGEAEANRDASVSATRATPRELLAELSRIPEDCLVLPRRHEVRPADIDPNRLERILLRTYERRPENYEQLVALEGVGAKTLRALSLAAELMYGQPVSWRDPARFSFAHGGKDGHPYPVDRAVYDEVIHHLGETLNRAAVAHAEKTEALKRLAKWGEAGSLGTLRHEGHRAQEGRTGGIG
mgnify:CR=1 FL=1